MYHRRSCVQKVDRDVHRVLDAWEDDVTVVMQRERLHFRVTSSVEVFLVQAGHRRALPKIVIRYSLYSVRFTRATSARTDVGSATVGRGSGQNLVRVGGSIAQVIGRKAQRRELLKRVRSTRQRGYQILLFLIFCVSGHGLRMKAVSGTRL